MQHLELLNYDFHQYIHKIISIINSIIKTLRFLLFDDVQSVFFKSILIFNYSMDFIQLNYLREKKVLLAFETVSKLYSQDCLF